MLEGPRLKYGAGVTVALLAMIAGCVCPPGGMATGSVGGHASTAGGDAVAAEVSDVATAMDQSAAVASQAVTDSGAYFLPFERGTRTWVGQGNHGPFSHQDDFAIDFIVPEHTPITAAREGEVIALFVDQTENCWPRGDCRWNFVRIRHGDGTVATYGHLEHDGARVAVGQRVGRGAFIAYSGHTGYSFMPHLHFEVADPSEGRGLNNTIEVRFADVCDGGVPWMGQVLVAEGGVGD
jgi:murein DD-endopeptidase MepM/ murein hydrolase activator NlpD